MNFFRYRGMPKSKEKLPPTQRLVCRFIIPSSSTSSSSSQSSSSEIDANSISGDGDDDRRPKNVLIQQRLKMPKKEKKHLLYPDDYEFTIPAAEQIKEKKKIIEEEEINKRKEEEIKMAREEEIKMAKEKEEERMKKNLPHSNSIWDESENDDDGKKFEDGTTMSACSSKSEYGDDDDDDDEIGLTIRSIVDEDEDDLGLTLTDMGDDETVKLCDDEDEDNLTTIGPEDFDNDDAKTLAAASPTPTIPAEDEDFPQQQQSNSPNIYWRPEEFEPIKMDLSDLNKTFDWGKYSIGVVVEQIRQPSTGKLICYKVSPFCTGDPLIPEMFLETEKILQLGEWVQFNRGDLFARNINPETFKSHPQMFRTMPVLLDVVMECEITVPKPRGIIQSKWARWQTKLERENSQSQARFIHRVYDDSKMITDEHLGQDWWAVVEYQRRVHWEERMGLWRIVNIRPQCYGKWDEQQEENNDDDQKPCSSRQMK